MYNQKEIIEKLDNITCKKSCYFTETDRELLLSIRESLVNAKKEKEILRWISEILKFFGILNDIF